MTKEEFRDIFSNAIIEVLGTMGIALTECSGKNIMGNAVHIQIEFIGQIKGYLIFELPEVFGVSIANIMFAGMMTATLFDEMCKSALGEMVNMISGSICTGLSNVGITSDIKPPLVDIRDKALDSSKVSLSVGLNNNVINAYFIAR